VTPPLAEPPGAEAGRRLRRAEFLAELAEARELMARVAPRRSRLARLRRQTRLLSYLR